MQDGVKELELAAGLPISDTSKYKSVDKQLKWITQ